MYILAVDPGTQWLGYAVFDIDTESLIEWGEWDIRKVAYDRKFMAIHAYLADIEMIFDLEGIAVEDAVRFKGNRIPELEVAVATVYRFGKTRLRGPDRNYMSRKYHPSTWKASIVGKSNASKDEVRAAVFLRLGEHPFCQSDVDNHTVDAVAIGLHHLAVRKREVAA